MAGESVVKLTKQRLKEIIKEELLNEKENWQAVDNVFLNFLKANTKTLVKIVKTRDRKKIASGVESIISGLTNGLDAFKKGKF